MLAVISITASNASEYMAGIHELAGSLFAPGQEIFDKNTQLGGHSSAEAAKTPGRTAPAAAAAAATATTTAAATAATTTTAAATATAAPSHLLEAGVAAVFLVKKMEGREADVSNFFFAEQYRLRRRKIQFLRSIRIGQRRCGSTACERKGQSGSTQRWYRDFNAALPLRSSLHRHSRISSITCKNKSS